MTDRSRVTAAVVIATYRRPQILRESLSHWRGSLRAPDQFLVVDASPDALEQRGRIMSEFADLFSTTGSDYLVSGEPSTTRQRNIALDHVTADVVVFADDETHPKPDYLDKILEVYDADPESWIGGVGGIEARYTTVRGRLNRLMRSAVRPVARRFGTSPEQALPATSSVPASVAALGVVRVRDLHGNKMSFRTDLLRTERFDPLMLRYGYCEDLDISIRIGRTRALVRRSAAVIEHEVTAVGRIASREMFLVKWVNPAYLTEKLLPYEPNRRPLRRMFRLARLRSMASLASMRDPEERARRRELFGVAERMILFLQDSHGDLSERFAALQRYIFQPREGFQIDRRESFERWLVTSKPRTTPDTDDLDHSERAAEPSPWGSEAADLETSAKAASPRHLPLETPRNGEHS